MVARTLSDSDILSIINTNNRSSRSVPITLITANNKEQLYQTIAPIQKFIIHYQSSDEGYRVSGHWAGMVVDHPHKLIYFYDSYGFYPDNELKVIDPLYRLITDQCTPHIKNYLNAMKRQGYTVHYNEFPHQEFVEGINTCGRWVGYFLRTYNPGDTNAINTFNNLITCLTRQLQSPSNDQTIVYLTDKYLRH